MQLPFVSRGLFWSSTDAVPEGNFAPDHATHGTLTIDETGNGRLELDRFLGNESHSRYTGAKGQEIPPIVGLLQNRHRNVFILAPTPAGWSYNTANVSNESFSCSCTLASETNSFANRTAIEACSLQIELEELEEWLWGRGITVSRTEGGIRVDAALRQGTVYTTKLGRFELFSSLSYPYPGKYDEISLKIHDYLDIRPENRLTVEESIKWFSHVTEFFRLMSGVALSLPYPVIEIDDGFAAEIIFQRVIKTSVGSPLRTTAVPLSAIRENLGEFICRFFDAFDRFGAGVYLLGSVHRNPDMYIENRFVSYVWGLESFHRTVTNNGMNVALREKLDRILSNVQLAKDKKWLTKRFEHGAEPSLDERIYELIGNLKLPLNSERVRAFALSCGSLRNQISHFGGPRVGRIYRDFSEQLFWHSEALNYLYHAIVLQQIGIPSETIDRWLFKGNASYRIGTAFEEVGLVEKSQPEIEDAPLDPRAGAARENDA